jgi:DNA polymerase-3 subunit gamma/tau
MTIADVRRLWPQVLDKIRELRRFAWVMLSQNAQVMALDGTTLTIALVNPGARDSFISSRSDEYVQQALHAVLGVTWTIEAVVDPSARPAASSTPAPDPAPAPVEAEPAPAASSAAAREAMNDAASPEDSNPDASADRDDPVVESEDIDPELLLSRELGAEVIGETSTD